MIDLESIINDGDGDSRIACNYVPSLFNIDISIKLGTGLSKVE